MATLEELLAAQLATSNADVLSENAQNAIASENVYNRLGAVTDAASQTGLTAYSSAPTSKNLKEAIGVSLLSGLLGGVFSGLGKGVEQSKAAQYRAARQDLAQGGTGQVEGISGGLFEAAMQDNALFKVAQQQETASMAREILKAGLLEEAKKRGELSAYGDGGDSSLINPINEKKIDLTNNLRKELNGKKEIQDFNQIERYASTINEALDDPSAMSDLELVRYSILLIEPGMAVREGEQAAVSAAQSIPEALKGQISKALSGESGLRTEARESLRRLAKRAYEGSKNQYDKTLNQYSGIAKRNGLNVEDIIPMATENPKIENLLMRANESQTAMKEGKAPTLDINAIVDKINTQGAESLTSEELAFAKQEKDRLTAKTEQQEKAKGASFMKSLGY